jgi:hypothetical protein
METGMDAADILVLVVGVLLAAGIALGVRYFLHGKRFVLHESGTRFIIKPDRDPPGDADLEASFSSEQIEEMVKSKLAEHADLLDTHFDFRTSPDGMLEIVFGERTYHDVSQIPDERVRRAIAEAVAEFNRE